MGGETAPAPAGRAGPRFQRLPADKRRGEILAVARRMFTELPYAEVATSAIAEAAGVRRGLIHYYFGTKRELFLEVVRGMTAAVAVEAPLPAADLTLEATVDVCVDLYLSAAEANATTWFAAVDAEGFGQDPELMRIVGRARDVTVEHMLKVLRLPEASDTLRVVLRTYSGLAEVATREWLQQKTIDRPQAHALLSRSLLLLITEVAPMMEQPPRGPDLRVR